MNEYDNYKLATPPAPDEDYWEYLQEHHECCICGEMFHEDEMHRTAWGFIDKECYDEIVKNSLEDGSEIPEII